MCNCNNCKEGVFSDTEHNCLSQQNCDCNCDSCNQSQDCGCISEYSGACIRYDGESLPCTNIPIGLNFNEIVQAIDNYFCVFRDEINNFITILNIGNGAKIYSSDNLLGQKQLRTLVSDNGSLTIVENTDTINFDLIQSSETEQGIAEIATQDEVNAGTDDERIVTPAKLSIYTNETITNILSDPSNLPNASETERGIIEIATQAEVDAGTDTERAVTPSTLQQSITTILSDPANLPVASFTQQGVIEIATQTEVDAGTDTERAVTPATLSASVTNILSDPNNLPFATETQRGIAEIATQAEVDAGTDDEKIVTPAKLSSSVADILSDPSNLPNATETQRGIAEIATQAEVDAGTDDERFVTPAKLQQKIDDAAVGGVFTQSFETTITTWDRYDTFTFAHGFGGVIPKLMQVVLVAKTTANGYAAGDEIWMDTHRNVRPDTPQWYGVRVSSGTTNIELRVGLSINLPVDPNAERTLINDSNDAGGYSLRIKAYA